MAYKRVVIVRLTIREKNIKEKVSMSKGSGCQGITEKDNVKIWPDELIECNRRLIEAYEYGGAFAM